MKHFIDTQEFSREELSELIGARSTSTARAR